MLLADGAGACIGVGARLAVPARGLHRPPRLEGRRRPRRLLAGAAAWSIGIFCFLGLFGVLGALLPLPAIVPILLYIGLLIGAQAFQAVPRSMRPPW